MRKLVLCLLCVATACGTDTDQAAEPTPDDGPTATPSSTVAQCEDRTPATPSPEESPSDEKPAVAIPDGPPPCELVIQDIHVGEGTEAEEGGTVTVQYIGVAWSTREQFDASWDRGEPATFPLGNVIRGWQEGIPGMKEGGRRRLIIPPDLAYADQPPPGSGIEPNETLVFVIDLIEAG